jgi:hypothetical protein
MMLDDANPPVGPGRQLLLEQPQRLLADLFPQRSRPSRESERDRDARAVHLDVVQLVYLHDATARFRVQQSGQSGLDGGTIKRCGHGLPFSSKEETNRRGTEDTEKVRNCKLQNENGKLPIWDFCILRFSICILQCLLRVPCA